MEKKFICNYIFILGILLLFLNDHFFKWEFSNWITGKVSDFVGVLILPFLITYFFPKRIKLNILISVLIFMFWKSSLSTDIINIYNKFAPIRISRVIDYSDYLALLIIPLSYNLIKKIKNETSSLIFENKVKSIIILLPTLLIFMATSPPKSYYLTKTNSNFRCYNCNFTIPLSQSSIVKKLQKFNIEKDTSFNMAINRYNFITDSLQYYKIKEFIIDRDTLTNLELSMLKKRNGKTKIYFNGFDYQKEITNDKMETKLRKYYKKIIKNYFKKL